MVRLAPVVLLYAPEQPLQHGLISRTASKLLSDQRDE
jgi:hypothetical protein